MSLVSIHLLMQSAHTLTVSRLDIQHYAMQQASGKRFFAPIEEPRRAIDIGTGTGTWMLVSIYTAYFMSITYRCPCRKWPLTFQNVNSSALIFPHYSQLPYCRKIAALSLLMYLKVRIESKDHIEASC
jgi:hypothetical protein